MKENITALILTFGYAEDQLVGLYAYYNELGAGTKVEALRSLADELFNQYKARFTLKDYKYNVCCRISIKDADNSFCPKCGLRLISPAVDPQSFAQWLYGLHCKNFNDYNAQLRLGLLHTWDIGMTFGLLKNLNDNEVYEIHEKAETILASAVSPDLLTETERVMFSNILDYFDDLETGIENHFIPKRMLNG